jgi:hypothetical protein
MIVAGKGQNATELRRPRGVAVAEHVAAAINSGALAIPDADHAVVIGAG